MSDTRQQQYSKGYIWSFLVTLFCVATAALLFFNRQFVIDQATVWQYHPDAAVVSLADRSSMSSSGKFYFYASQPKVVEAQELNKQCNKQEASTAILGCYNGRNIFVYNVTNSQLDGIREVTAAHEMLHAVYQRMGDGEKEKVDALLEDEYNKLKDDKDFAQRMAFYARTEPGQRDNELHSVIGTEVKKISPELEEHYKKYFEDRSKVIALHDKYQTVFMNLQNQADELSNKLTSLGNTIEQESADYNKRVSQLNADIDAFNTRANNGSFKNQATFESERAALVDRANELDATRTAINADITQYESYRKQLETVAIQSDALNQSINSSLAPAPSL